MNRCCLNSRSSVVTANTGSRRSIYSTRFRDGISAQQRGSATSCNGTQCLTLARKGTQPKDGNQNLTAPTNASEPEGWRREGSAITDAHGLRDRGQTRISRRNTNGGALPITNHFGFGVIYLPRDLALVPAMPRPLVEARPRRCFPRRVPRGRDSWGAVRLFPPAILARNPHAPALHGWLCRVWRDSRRLAAQPHTTTGQSLMLHTAKRMNSFLHRFAVGVETVVLAGHFPAEARQQGFGNENARRKTQPIGPCFARVASPDSTRVPIPAFGNSATG